MTGSHAPTRPSIPPLAWLALGMWSGIVLAEGRFASRFGHGGGTEVWFWGSLGLLALLGVAYVRWRRGAFLLAALGLLVGACLSGLNLEAWLVATERLAEEGTVQTSCRVVDDPRSGMWGDLVRVRPGAPAFGGLDATLLLGDERTELGRALDIRGIVQVPEYESERGRWAWREGLVGTVRPWSVDETGWSGGLLGTACRIRHAVGGDLAERGGTGSALMAGMLLGDRRQLRGTSTETDFRVAGLSHLLAVSGLHLGLVSIGVGWALRAIGAPRGLQATGVLAAALSFTALTGVQVSTVRALCMVVLAWVASMTGRRGDALGALSATVCIVLGHRPMAAFDVSLQLSAAAVGGLLVFGGLAGAWVERAAGFRPMTGAIGATIVAQAATWPVIAGTFHSFSLVAPVGNAMAIPLAAVGLGCGVMSLVAPGRVLSRGLLAVGTAALEWCAAVAATLAGVPGAAVCVGSPSVLAVGLWLSAGALLWAVWPVARRRFHALAAVAAGILACVAIGAGMPDPGDRLVMLDVGQADAILLQDAGESMLVDCGAVPGDIQAALGRYGVRRLDVLVLTHAHEDHFGGMEGLVGTTRIGWVGVPDSAGQEAFEGPRATTARLTPRGDVPWRTLRAGDRWTVGRTTVHVVWPRGPDPAGSTNDTSVILLLERAGFEAVLGADAEEGSWRSLAASGQLPDVDVLKVAHHGSRNGVESSALTALDAEIALVSVGEGNRFGHPSPEALSMLRRSGSRVWRTDLLGDVVVTLDASPTCVAKSTR